MRYVYNDFTGLSPYDPNTEPGVEKIFLDKFGLINDSFDKATNDAVQMINEKKNPLDIPQVRHWWEEAQEAGLPTSLDKFAYFTPSSKEELQTAVDEYQINSDGAIETYGNISNWNICYVEDLSGLFDPTDLTDIINPLTSIDLSSWDVSHVTNMQGMFNNATSLTDPGDLSGWCVSNLSESSSYANFASQTPWESNTSIHPVWGTCPH